MRALSTLQQLIFTFNAGPNMKLAQFAENGLAGLGIVVDNGPSRLNLLLNVRIPASGRFNLGRRGSARAITRLLTPVLLRVSWMLHLPHWARTDSAAVIPAQHCAVSFKSIGTVWSWRRSTH